MDHEPQDRTPAEPAHSARSAPPERRPPSREKAFVSLLIVAAGVSIALYRWLVFGQLEQTAALFIGLPTALAVCVTLLPSSRSATGSALQGVTICLLVSMMVLGEGFACVLMAAPLFASVACILGAVIDEMRLRKKETLRVKSLALAPFLLLSLEGVAPELSFPREESVSIERTVPASAREVEATLDRTPRLDLPLPFYFRLGFPRVAAVDGGGIALGDRTRVHLAGGEGAPGDRVLEVARRAPGLCEWTFLEDSSHVAHWTGLERARVEWRELPSGETLVRWTLDYERRLDPAWYFGPMQRYAARLAGGYLIECMATPRDEASR